MTTAARTTSSAPHVASSAPHVVCIGGGYGAIYLLKALRRALRSGEVQLTIIDRNNYHCFHGLVPEVLVGKIEAGNVLSSSRRIFRPAQFRNAEVEAIDLEAREVTISRNLDGKQFTVSYDHLVVNAGSKENLRSFGGIAEHTMRLKAYPDILSVRHHVISMLELAEIETDPEERRRLLTFVIVGGNYAGVEVASEFADFLPRIARANFPNVNVEEIRIVLVHSGERVLPELGEHYPKLMRYAESYLQKLPLELRTGIRMRTATPEEAVLENDERIPTRTVISCAGIQAQPIVSGLPFEHDASGRLVTDKFLNVVGQSHVWACGDCAAVPHPQGGTCPPLAIWAMTAGKQVGRNILRRIRGQELRPYRFNGLGDACTLGRWRAVAHVKGFQVKGFIAYLVWRFFMLVYLPAKEKKLRTFWDWIIGGIFGRDLINMNLQQGLSVASAIYEPGQDIVREGEIGRTMFVIRSGEVDVVQNAAGEEKHIRTLEAGDHFGELAVFRDGRRTATVRAKTRVEVVLVRRDAAVALSESLTAVDEALKTPWSQE